MSDRPSSAEASLLSISIVTWRVDASVFAPVLRHLQAAVALLARERAAAVHVNIVDNGDDAALINELLLASGLRSHADLVSSGKNVGYGRAHNLAIASTSAPYHLIMNPDVLVAEDALIRAVEYLEQHPNVVAVSPSATDGNGQTAYLCKRYPAVLDLALRGFAPRALRKLFSARLERYESRALSTTDKAASVDLISGCFMFCRSDALKKAGGFSPAYFLYFEDFSLSLELRKFGQLMYVPACRIVHYGGHAGKKGLRHITHFMSSAFKFYNQYGWKLF